MTDQEIQDFKHYLRQNWKTGLDGFAYLHLETISLENAKKHVERSFQLMKETAEGVQKINDGTIKVAPLEISSFFSSRTKPPPKKTPFPIKASWWRFVLSFKTVELKPWMMN